MFRNHDLNFSFCCWFQQQMISKLWRRRCSILISDTLSDVYELLTFFFCKKRIWYWNKNGRRSKKNINFFLVFNFFNNLPHINHRAKDSLFIAFILEQIFVYDIWNIYLKLSLFLWKWWFVQDKWVSFITLYLLAQKHWK